MAVSNVHINPVAPDQSASGQYGGSQEQAGRDTHTRQEWAEDRADRLEISRKARERNVKNAADPDMDFARKALQAIEPLPESRIEQILHRIEAGYYRIPEVLGQVVTRVVTALR